MYSTTYSVSNILCLAGGTLTVHRKDMVDFLLRHVPASCEIQTSKKLKSYEVNSETGKITLYFSDGSSSIADVLVGADGIRSATRKTMYQNLASSILDDDTRKRLFGCIDPVWTGMLVYRNLVPTTKLLKEYPDVKLPTGLTLVSHVASSHKWNTYFYIQYLGKNKVGDNSTL